ADATEAGGSPDRTGRSEGAIGPGRTGGVSAEVRRPESAEGDLSGTERAVADVAAGDRPVLDLPAGDQTGRVGAGEAPDGDDAGQRRGCHRPPTQSQDQALRSSRHRTVPSVLVALQRGQGVTHVTQPKALVSAAAKLCTNTSHCPLWPFAGSIGALSITSSPSGSRLEMPPATARLAADGQVSVTPVTP